MKLRNYVFTTIVVSFSFGANAQSNEQQTFSNKFEIFMGTSCAKMQWAANPMPNPIDIKETYVEEPKSGLWHYPNIGKVLDPETGHYVDYKSRWYYLYRVNSKTGKIYKGKFELAIKREETDQDQK